MENFFEREVKRLAFVEERMKIREQEKKQLDAEESRRQQVRVGSKRVLTGAGNTMAASSAVDIMTSHINNLHEQ